MSYLELYQNNSLVRLVPLPKEDLYIGRKSDCDLALDTPNVSRRHAKLRPQGKGWRIIDLKSVNGTSVNGNQIHYYDLVDGDKIDIGDFCLVFHVGQLSIQHPGPVQSISPEQNYLERTITEHDFKNIVCIDVKMKTVLAQVVDVAASGTTTLLIGESGTGKELIAQAIHDHGPRSENPFVAVNCMALASSVVESELFGHEKGSFTGAAERKIGRFEAAQGGTLFLDEIGELSSSVQVKLLRVLQERSLERLGGNETIPLDVRIIAATNADLQQKIRQGTFREDLYYRLAVFTIEVPPLRERKKDITPLSGFFVKAYNKKLGKNIDGLSPEVEAALLDYAWPGNVRELKNVIEHAFVLERTNLITISSLPYDIASAIASDSQAAMKQPIDMCEWPTSFNEAKSLFEKRFLLAALKKHKGNISATARELELPRNTVYRKIEAFKLGEEDWGGED